MLSSFDRYFEFLCALHFVHITTSQRAAYLVLAILSLVPVLLADNSIPPSTSREAVPCAGWAALGQV